MFEKTRLRTENLALLLLILTPIFYIIGSLFANLSILLLFVFYLLIEPKNKFLILLAKYKFYLIFAFLILLINILNSENSNLSTIKGVAFFRYILFGISLSFLINFISKKNIKIYTKFLVLLILFLVFDSFLQFFLKKDIFGFSYIETYKRITGPFGDEMIIGSYLLNIGFLSLSFLNYFYKIEMKYNIFLFLLISITILFTGERSAFLSAIYFFALVFLISREKKMIFLIGFILIILSTLLIKNSEILSNKYTSLLKVENNINKIESNSLNENKEQIESKFISFNSKLKYIVKNSKWAAHFGKAIEIFNDNLFLGSGFRTYRQVCLQNYENSNLDDLKCSIHPHNYHLEILSDNGIVGYLTFLLLIFFITYKFIKGKFYKNFGISILFCLIITFIIPFKPTGSFFTTNTAFIFWFLIGHFFGLLLYKKKIKS